MSGLLGLFTSCFRPSSSKSEQLPDAPNFQPDDPHYRLPRCIFCNVSRENGFDVVWEDDEFVVFNDRSPASARHMLVIPKRHIESVKTLKHSDVPLLARMAEIGTRMLADLDVTPESRKLGFHIPPFNSVNHLHLHTQALPYKNAVRGAEYPIARGKGGKEKGFSWFVEVGQAVKILEGGGRVGVWPC